MRNTSYFKSKRFRYGSVATALTAVFIALVVLFNVIFTAVAGKFLWYVDMTEEMLFSLSDEAKTILSDVTAEVNIYFAEDEDQLKTGSESSYMNYIYTTALQIREAFPNVNVECHDIIKENTFFEEYKTMLSSDITATSVIVESGEEFYVYTAESFYILDENDSVWAYNGEYRFLSAILQVTATEKPIVYFTESHGEDLASAQTLMALFHDAGFEVLPINLATDEISEDARIIVIANPIYDFIGSEAEDKGANEIAKLDAFLDSIHHGCLMTFIEPEYVSALTNLNEFLEEWGIKYTADTVVRDYEHSLTVDGLSILTEYNKDTEDFGSNLYLDMLDLTNLPKSVVSGAAPIEVLWTKGGGLNGTRLVSPLLMSYDTAEALKGGEKVGEGVFNLMTVSCEARIYDNNYYYSYVFAAPASFADSKYLLHNSYANRDLINSAMQATGQSQILADIDFKVLDVTDLDITTAEANRWTVALTLVMPVIVGAVGVVVWVRRKHL